MVGLLQALEGLDAQRLRGMRRGLEKESLRALPSGRVALTPHPAALGSALTHPRVTTDYSESQLELITGVHAGVDDCLQELTEIHQAVYRATLAALRPRETTVGVMLALYEYPYAAVWPAPELPGGKFLFPLEAADLDAKIAACAAYESQFGRPGVWLTTDRVREWARARGAEVGALGAEAFWLVRGILQ